MVVIQESKLSSKSKNSCSRNYTTVRRNRPHGHGAEFIILIPRSTTVSQQLSSPESLSNPYLGKLTITADIGNRKLIIFNIYIPPTSSSSNGYHSSIYHLLTAQDTLILGNFKRARSVLGLRVDLYKGMKIGRLNQRI